MGRTVIRAISKDWHGMRRFRLRRLWRVNSEALMIASGQNLKRLLKQRGWGRRPYPAEAVFALFLASWWLMSRLSLGDASTFPIIHSPSLLSKRKPILSS